MHIETQMRLEAEEASQLGRTSASGFYVRSILLDGEHSDQRGSIEK